MCMLCVIPAGVMPSREKLENSALNNPHGFGFAIAVPSEQRIIVERTMDPDESINRFLELRAQYMEGYAMWHARLATHGSRTVENCHPFRVGKDNMTYLAHNGIIDIHIAHADDRSDTRVFAEDLLPAIGGVTALDNELVWDMLEGYTYGSKVCVLTVNPEAEHQMYLLNASAGKEDEDGVWWSNDSCYLSSFSWSPKSTVAKPYAHFNDDYDWNDGFVVDKTKSSMDSEGSKMYECPGCNKESSLDDIMDWENHCPKCDWCYDCMLDWSDCLCFNPGVDTWGPKSIAKHVIPSTRVANEIPY